MGTPADRIRELGPLWRWGGRGPITDPVDMDFKLGEEVQQRLTLVRLEAAASVHRALADGYAKAAQLLGKAKG
jgi:hypothetical protein